MSTPIRIVIAEDQAVVRQGLIAILSFYDDIEVVGQAKNGIEAVELAKELSPNVILLDLVMPVQDGLSTIPKITTLAPETHILILTGFGDADKIYKALKLGALGYLLKDEKHEILIKAIHEVAEGKAYIPPYITLRMVREKNQTTPLHYENHLLTQRELETLKYIAQGMSNEEIAKNMVLQERTVAKYVSTILEKLNLQNRTQAALYALRKGLADLDDSKLTT
ncbi:MAG: response regulator transcription factor [Anaerolineae bacterium]|jgi:two-component system, NarL family, response regulator LiaR|nr:response regulator transcription factor [Anaerolineae bacterium]MBT7071608.1 response regulator transcription factor [Anaerolineae bacterium]MBT7326329.1 response regulator transcription factor [Anaerolineae bacterium]